MQAGKEGVKGGRKEGRKKENEREELKRREGESPDLQCLPIPTV